MFRRYKYKYLTKQKHKFPTFFAIYCVVNFLILVAFIFGAGGYYRNLTIWGWGIEYYTFLFIYSIIFLIALLISYLLSYPKQRFIKSKISTILLLISIAVFIWISLKFCDFIKVGNFNHVHKSNVYFIKHAKYSAWLAYAWLMISAIVVIYTGFKARGRKGSIKHFNAFVECFYYDSTVPVILGAAGLLAIIFYPRMEEWEWLGKKPIEPFHYWLAIFTFIGLLATPVIKGLFEFYKVYNKVFQNYIERKVRKAKRHRIFVGFGHLGNIVFLEFLRSINFLSSERVVFPDYEVCSVVKNIIVIEKDPSLFHITFQTSSGDTLGVIKRSYPVFDDKLGQSVLKDIYLIGILGDASRQDTLEKAHFRFAEDIICTIPDIVATLAVFDLQNELSKKEAIQ
jgi:voltage-gated potassium channel Kch